MDYQEYSQILKETVLANGKGCMILAALLIGVIVVDWLLDIIFLKGKGGGKSRAKFAILAVVVVILYAGVVAAKCLPAIKDIENESYVCVHGEYYMFNYNYRSDKDSSIYVTLDNGEKIDLILPKRLEIPRIDAERFPSGKIMGTVWYAENSHYILEFIPD